MQPGFSYTLLAFTSLVCGVSYELCRGVGCYISSRSHHRICKTRIIKTKNSLINRLLELNVIFFLPLRMEDTCLRGNFVKVTATQAEKVSGRVRLCVGVIAAHCTAGDELPWPPEWNQANNLCISSLFSFLLFVYTSLLSMSPGGANNS